jgi:hypothetical protein
VPESSAPLDINSCYLTYSNASGTISGLDVRFTNNSTKTATVVNIHTDVNGTRQIIRDQGSFAPGIQIHHSYKAGGEQFALPVMLKSVIGSKPLVMCSLSSVQFADGSRWPEPEPVTQNGASAITVAPLSLNLNGSGTINARLLLATGSGPLGMTSNCGQIANVELLASTSRDIAVRVTPKASGSCAITVRDSNDNVATVPVLVP